MEPQLRSHFSENVERCLPRLWPHCSIRFTRIPRLQMRVMPSKHSVHSQWAKQPSGIISSTYCPQPKIKKRDDDHPVACGTMAVHLVLIMLSHCWSIWCGPFSSHMPQTFSRGISFRDGGSGFSIHLFTAKHPQTSALYWALNTLPGLWSPPPAWARQRSF